MIDINDIIRHAQNTDYAEAREILWHLHSYLCEDDGPKRFERELKEWFPSEADKVMHAFYCSPISGAIKFMMGHIGCSAGTKASTITHLLYAHKERSEKLAREKFYLTNIGRAVWDSLDDCLEERRPCFLQGFEGRGKSASAHAWSQLHRGQARYVSLPGICTQRDFFGHIALAYGIPFRHANAPNQVRFRVRDAVVRSGLVLILDEAHFVLPKETKRGRPELIDWIDTELCNAGVAVALITTPQFGAQLSAFENFSTWNGRQFRRRFASGWRQLEQDTERGHLEALAKKFLPAAGDKGVKLAVTYAESFTRDVVKFRPNEEGIKLSADVSGMFDLVRDAQKRARRAGRSEASLQDVRDAYQLDRLPAENAMAAAFAGPIRTRRTSAAAAPQQISSAETPVPVPRRELQPSTGSGRRVDTLNPQPLEPAS